MVSEQFFTEKTVRTLIENPHLLGHLMGKDKLNELHSEWIKYCWDSNEPKALQAFRGGYKCFSPLTKVMMSDGSSRVIEGVNVGDYVMGWDSKPRRVLEKHSGKDLMYRVSYKDTDFHYECNSQHELVLKVSEYHKKQSFMRRFDKYAQGDFYIIPVCDFLKFPWHVQDFLFYHVRCIKGMYNFYHQHIEPIGEGDFVGIQIEGDGIFLLSDFSLVHNSTAIDVVGIVRWWLLQPNDRIALIRKSFNDACTVVSAVRQAMEMPEIKELFKFAHGFYPKAMTAKDGKLRYNFKTTITPEVSLTAHGIDSSLTGMHYDKIICDDIITLKDRISRAERIKTKEMVNEIATNIIDPHKGSIWVGTPWHRDDAWVEINSFCDIAQYPMSKFNFLGEEAAKKKKATTTPFLYAANYELEIMKDENSLFTDPKYSQAWNFFKRGFAHVDGAYDGDHFCGFTILSPLDGKEMPFSQNLQGIGWTYPGNVKDWIPFIVKMCKQYKVSYIFCETNPDKGYLATQLRENGLRVKTYAETENKHVKISTNLYEYWDKILWSPETDPEYMNQILDYREGSEPDDAPDSCASLLREACKPAKARSRSLYEW